MRNVLRDTEVVSNLLHRVEPSELANPHTHGVARMYKAVGAGHGAAVSAVGICRRPISRAINFARLNRAITDRSARQQPVAESNSVNEGFERRTNLPVCGSHRPVELALRVIAPADQRANAAAGIVD